jgi:hypothetical protein
MWQVSQYFIVVSLPCTLARKEWTLGCESVEKLASLI